MEQANSAARKELHAIFLFSTVLPSVFYESLLDNCFLPGKELMAAPKGAEP